MEFPPDITDRVLGALLGLACGDALGAPAEFRSQEDLRATLGEINEMVGGGMWEPGEWTDDTGMTLATAEGILANPSDPVDATGERFLEWRRTAKDVGSTISAALSAYRGDWAAASRSTPQATRGKAAGNGSLMRTLPVSLVYSDSDTMLRTSARLSAMTHWDAQAEVCCAVYCLCVREVLRGRGLYEAWHESLQAGRQTSERGSLAPDTPGPKPLPTGFWVRLKAVESLRYDQLQPTGYAGYALECLEAAAWCCLNSDSVEQTLVRAANLAGDSDTIAAVAGGIAGAFWGYAGVPNRWLISLHRREDLKNCARSLAELRRHLEVYSTPGLPAFDFHLVADRLYAGRNPLTARDVEVLHARGITHILDLREEKEWTAPRFGSEALDEIEHRGIARQHMPVIDMGAPTPQAMDDAYQHIKRVLIDPYLSIYVHCRAGNERTAAMLTAYYAREHKLPYEHALAKLRESGRGFQPLPAQERAVKEWLGKQ